MPKYILTMPLKQEFLAPDGELHSGYAIVWAVDGADAREAYVARFGNNFAFVYESEELAGVAEYHLHCFTRIVTNAFRQAQAEQASESTRGPGA